ncbi:hypothetical protein CspeluHIS016_0801380 [Cutaneotrichosporon spelunceum]|uniref:AB hydrolase-1 domain-containing protein n=1 Tax=Cutaneotrichosporon spelunceum TaxID=1672016 RepID=A0AAD3U039_9TREE|nr:hypothetical protein CspeluHIS016_0801380 [Cutaneotrichosporon spelunceum]
MDTHLDLLEGLGPPGATRRPTRRVKSIERTWAWVRSRSSVYGEQALMGLEGAHEEERRAFEMGRPLTVASAAQIPDILEVATPVRRVSTADVDPDEKRRRRQGLTPESLRPPPRPRSFSRSQTTPLLLTATSSGPSPPGPSSTASSPTPKPNGAPRQRPRPITGKPPPPAAAIALAAVTASNPASPCSSTASSAQTPVQSINDIVRRHSIALTLAQEHVKDRARLELASKHSKLGTSKQSLLAEPVLQVREDPSDIDDESYDYVDQEAPPPPLPPKQQRYLHSREPSRGSLGSFNSSDTDSVVRDFRLAQAAYDQLSAKELRIPIAAPPPVIHPPTPTRNNIFSPTPDHSPGAGHNRERDIYSPDPDSLSRQRSATSLPRPNSASPRPNTSDDDAREIAMYLRSPHLNRIMHLPRAFPERPLQVSFADLGKFDGRPVVVFLGLGSVRYLVALYDDLARALGLRLICIDRWGLGKTDQVPQDRRGLLDWADVVRQVLDELGINRFQMIAHSAGAPYALATALKMERRVHGKIHLLSPWVGGDVEGYKWLKWVPNGVIKSALAAEWRLESYFLGKAPSLKTKGKVNGRAGTPGTKDGHTSTTSLNTDAMRSQSTVSDLPAGDSLDGFSDDLSLALPGKYEPFVSPITASPAFAHALVQANHAESLSGTTADLLSVVLGRDAKPWGFSYTDILHPCKIWYGAEDERVSEKSMRWMERAMDAELIVVKEEGHNLMSSRTVMYDVLDSIAEDI